MRQAIVHKSILLQDQHEIEWEFRLKNFQDKYNKQK